jgi:hypothetical protein
MGTTNRLGRIAVALSSAAVVLAFVVGPAGAASPTDVRIVSHMHFNPDGPNTGDFVATGSAVDDGLICPSGSVIDTRLIFAGSQSGRGAQIPVRKTFTCDDASGTIFVKIQVHLDFASSTETFSWVILGGTGVYATLHGSGQGSTVGDGTDPQTGNFNRYVGFLVD